MNDKIIKSILSNFIIPNKYDLFNSLNSNERFIMFNELTTQLSKTNLMGISKQWNKEIIPYLNYPIVSIYEMNQLVQFIGEKENIGSNSILKFMNKIHIGSIDKKEICKDENIQTFINFCKIYYQHSIINTSELKSNIESYIHAINPFKTFEINSTTSGIINLLNTFQFINKFQSGNNEVSKTNGNLSLVLPNEKFDIKQTNSFNQLLELLNISKINITTQLPINLSNIHLKTIKISIASEGYNESWFNKLIESNNNLESIELSISDGKTNQDNVFVKSLWNHKKLKSISFKGFQGQKVNDLSNFLSNNQSCTSLITEIGFGSLGVSNKRCKPNYTLNSISILIPSKPFIDFLIENVKSNFKALKTISSVPMFPFFDEKIDDEQYFESTLSINWVPLFENLSNQTNLKFIDHFSSSMKGNFNNLIGFQLYTRMNEIRNRSIDYTQLLFQGNYPNIVKFSTNNSFDFQLLQNNNTIKTLEIFQADKFIDNESLETRTLNPYNSFNFLNILIPGNNNLSTLIISSYSEKFILKLKDSLVKNENSINLIYKSFELNSSNKTTKNKKIKYQLIIFIK